MIDRRFLPVLSLICTRLRGFQGDWVVTGSLGLALQGLDIAVHDIDLQTDQQGAYEIERQLSEYAVTPVRYLQSARIRSHLGKLDINGISVEIMGDVQKLLDGQVWEERVEINRHRHWIPYAGLRVPLLALDYEYHAYLRMGREEKAEKIRQWLEENPNTVRREYHDRNLKGPPLVGTV